MKTQQQLEQSLNNIINKINIYFDKSAEAMASRDDYKEDEYEERIRILEDKKDFIEWVLN